MLEPRKSSRRGGGMGGGVLLALALVAGAVLGVLFRQPTIGVLAGFGIGVALAILVWLIDRR